MRKEYSFLLAASVSIIFFHIFHEARRIQRSYEKQKLEHALAALRQELNEHELVLQARQNRESTTQWAIEHGMEEVKLSKIKKWQPT